MTRPDRTLGLSRLRASAGYSAAGALRLWREAAFRLEMLALAVAILLFLVTGAGLGALIGLLMLALIVVAVEALNTALEEIVDHLSPEWSEFAKHAKDLGSLAVACVLTATGLYILWVVLG